MAESRESPWLEYLETLFRRKHVVVTVLLTGVALTALVSWLRAPRYKASARIQLSSQALSGPRVQAMTDSQIVAELALLKSPRLLKTVLENDPSLLEPIEPTAGALSPSQARARQFRNAVARWTKRSLETRAIESVVEILADKIDIQRVGKSNVVEVAFTGSEPEKAARFVNDLLDQHIARITSLNEGAGAQTFFERQADLLGTRWGEASKALGAFRQEHGAGLSVGDERELRRFIQILEAQRVESTTRVLELTATIDFLAEQIESMPPTVAGELRESRDESVGLLKSRLLELQIQRIELLSTYTEESTVVKDTDRQITELRALLESHDGQVVSETMTELNPAHQALGVQLVQARSDLNTSQVRLSALDRQVANYRSSLDGLEEVLSELSGLENAVQNAKEAHQTYLKETESARLESALDASGSVNLTIVERAEVPVAPLPTNTVWLFLWGTLAALVVGAAGAIVRDRLDPTVKGGREVARLTGLPVIAEIPIE